MKKLQKTEMLKTKTEETKMESGKWRPPLFSGFKIDGEDEAALLCGWCREKHKVG